VNLNANAQNNSVKKWMYNIVKKRNSKVNTKKDVGMIIVAILISELVIVAIIKILSLLNALPVKGIFLIL
jgi:hypothetical protein